MTMGTGSTGVAAIKAGKQFVGIEKDERWFNVAVERVTAAWDEIRAREPAL
jgi:site-specific DNA-methyltransferase (adenine-specific)